MAPTKREPQHNKTRHHKPVVKDQLCYAQPRRTLQWPRHLLRQSTNHQTKSKQWLSTSGGGVDGTATMYRQDTAHKTRTKPAPNSRHACALQKNAQEPPHMQLNMSAIPINMRMSIIAKPPPARQTRGELWYNTSAHKNLDAHLPATVGTQAHTPTLMAPMPDDPPDQTYHDTTATIVTRSNIHRLKKGQVVMVNGGAAKCLQPNVNVGVVHMKVEGKVIVDF